MSTIYLDESGDLGFSKTKKVSKYFVITILFSDDDKQLEKLIKKTHQNLRKSIKKLSGGVLHCVKEAPRTKKNCFQILYCSSQK